MLAREGVEVVFGIIDGTYFGLYSHLRDHGIRLITPRHETSALHMAGAYARLTGRLGVAIASNGPGVANALPGVAVENGEGNRVLLLTSWRRHQIVGPDRGGAYQYFDQPAVIKPMAKWSGAALSFDRLPELFHRALRISWRGRPGVVHLTVAEDVMNTPAPDPAAGETPRPDIAPEGYRRTAPVEPPAELVEQAARMLTEADAPLLHAGSGVLHASATDELREVADRLTAPVTTSWAARDVIDERAEVSIPMPYTELNNEARRAADVVLVLGSRLGETDWWGKAPYWDRSQQVIQVDNDEELLGLNKPVTLAVLGDAKVFLRRLADRLAQDDLAPLLAEVSGDRRARLAAYHEQKDSARGQLDMARQATGAPLHSAHLAPGMQEVFGDDIVVVFDGGNTAVWGNLYYEVRAPHSVLSTFKFGMLGAGVPQALGAKVAHPGKHVVCLTGDGAFGFHPQEIETAVRNGLPMVAIVTVDRAWGMVKVNQEFAINPEKLVAQGSLDDDEHINTDLGEIRYDAMAESMGALGLHVSATEDLVPTLRTAKEGLEAGRVVVVHVDVDANAHKFAPSLLTFKEMHLEPAG